MASKNMKLGHQTPTTSIAAGFQIAQNAVILMLKEELPCPLEAGVISPNVLGELGNQEIQALPVALGNRPHRLGDFFEVEGEKSTCIELFGNLERVKWIGRGMTQGSIVSHGSVGMHLGSGMSGGSITVYGDASDWLGAEMTAGRIWVHGRAGSQVGGAYRRSQVGMQGGEILIEKTAGIEIGRRMHGGMICIQGRVGDFAGIEMKGGSLFLLGNAGLRVGAWMSAGTIVAYQPLVLLPTFLEAAPASPEILEDHLARLQELGVPIPGHAWNSRYQRFLGDSSASGKGEILICDPAPIKAKAAGGASSEPGSSVCN